ncbi:hypothetical protein ACGFNV_17345 [Streptomyces sp. NPDC048751]|uniref:hypothetical protein n=1 Tax=Streptomyces sp. NPDC048751 TaxID=3365591 RepID=UPI003717AEA2
MCSGHCTWERVFTTLMAQADADEDLAWAVSVASASIYLAGLHIAGIFLWSAR